MQRFGFIDIGIATPRIAVGDPGRNVDAILDLVDRGGRDGCDLLVLPELSLTGYTCADLFQQAALLDRTLAELDRLARSTSECFAGLLVVGLPLRVGHALFNVAAVLQAGRVLGLVPKSHTPNYKEFYERRWFQPARGDEPATVRLLDREVPFGTDLLFRGDHPDVTVGIEICEDLWVPIPPSSQQALAGATILLNLSASNETTAKAEYRRELVVNQSGRCVSAYAYSAAGVTESTTDLVFGGHSILAENGRLLAEANRFERESGLLVGSIDIEALVADRSALTTFADGPRRQGAGPEYRRIPFGIAPNRSNPRLRRTVARQPFVPGDPHRLSQRCHEIFHIQSAGLAQRVETVRPPNLVIGVSGGLDSTLALLVAVKACDLLRIDHERIHALTMPGFGTSSRTLGNARQLMQLLGVHGEEIDIRPLCLDTFATLGHAPFGIDVSGLTIDQFQDRLGRLTDQELHDLVFENVQARMRTMLLMNRGFVVGTGDLSELALGWCTYNADHMSMYNPNVSIPKTLVRFLVRWVADHEFTGRAREVLHSIADTRISPELLPIGADEQIQSTEHAVGPYELNDFFLFHVLRHGFGPNKIVYLAEQAGLLQSHSREMVVQTLREFYRRFFASQYKRSCLPDGPKVGSVSLSPRGDWRMPSDASSAAWIAELDGSSS